MMDRSHAEHEQEVARLVEAWNAAESRGDTVFLAQALADDFVAVGPRGFLLTKPGWLRRHQSGDLRYDALALDEVAVRVYDGAAVVIGRQRQDASFRGHRVEEAQLRTTAVLVHQGAGWQLVALHMSPVGQPPAFARLRGETGGTP
jgi:ketosteroid isomerase-like protein